MMIKKAVLVPCHRTMPSRVVLRSFPVVLGRGTDADVQVQDRWASRRHCEIQQAGGVLVVRDLGSRYGTLVNNAHVSEAP